MSSVGVYTNLDKCDERREADFYPTPWQATEALCQAERLHIEGEHFLEPACGDGAISKHLEEYYGCKVDSCDLHDRGYGRGGVDFITAKKSLIMPKRKKPKRCVTNPPFEVAEEFIRRCMGFKLDYTAMLLKATYYHASSRAAFFNEFPPSRIYPLAWRVDFTGGGANHFEVCWFIWDTAEESPFTLYMNPLKRPEFAGAQKML